MANPPQTKGFFRSVIVWLISSGKGNNGGGESPSQKAGWLNDWWMLQPPFAEPSFPGSKLNNNDTVRKNRDSLIVMSSRKANNIREAQTRGGKPFTAGRKYHHVKHWVHFLQKSNRRRPQNRIWFISRGTDLSPQSRDPSLLFNITFEKKIISSSSFLSRSFLIKCRSDFPGRWGVGTWTSASSSLWSGGEWKWNDLMLLGKSGS